MENVEEIFDRKCNDEGWKFDNPKARKFIYECMEEARKQVLKLTSVSSRLPFKDELDKLCKDYIETTRKEDEGKWFDDRMIDKVEFWCKWIREFAKANDY